MQHKIKNYFQYLLYLLFQFIFLITPKFIMHQFLKGLVFLAFKFNKKHKNIAIANLNLVYGSSLDNNRKNEIIYNSYKSFIFNVYEFIENQTISKEKMFEKATIINGDIIQKAYDEKRKIIYISGHYGGWELAIPYIALKFGELAIVSQKMNNPYFNKCFEKARNRNNVTMLEKKKAAKGMIKAFKENKAITVVIDQHIENGSEIEFLGQKVIATNSTSRLALKFDAIIIPIFALRNGFRDYTIKVSEPIDVRTLKFKADNKIDELTQLQTDVLSKQIFKLPDLWFWQHKRFKKYHRDIYKK